MSDSANRTVYCQMIYKIILPSSRYHTPTVSNSDQTCKNTGYISDLKRKIFPWRSNSSVLIIEHFPPWIRVADELLFTYRITGYDGKIIVYVAYLFKSVFILADMVSLFLYTRKYWVIRILYLENNYRYKYIFNHSLNCENNYFQNNFLTCLLDSSSSLMKIPRETRFWDIINKVLSAA